MVRAVESLIRGKKRFSNICLAAIHSQSIEGLFILISNNLLFPVKPIEDHLQRIF